jgi:hypothetical protein
MNLLHLLGILTLGVGGSVLLSAVVIGQDLLSDLTGFPLEPLYGGCIVAVVLGALAVHLGRQEALEQRQDKEVGTL